MEKLKDNYKYMKNNINKILFGILIAIVFTNINSTVLASTIPGVYVTPTEITKNVGELFSVSINVSASGSKVYAVEGTIDFKNLTCDSVTVAPGLMAQTTPTCAKPYFLIGIPNGTNKDTSVVDIKVKGASVGPANINITNVDIIGEGKSIGTNSTSGNYTIVGVNLGGSYVPPQSSGSKLTGSVTKTTGSSIDKKVAGATDTTKEAEIEANNQVASAGTFGDIMPFDWMLIVIIILLSTYITLREIYLKKNSK
jgi:hypothetical protein